MAASALTTAFERRKVEKYYVMMVHGVVDFQELRRDLVGAQQIPIPSLVSKDEENVITIQTFVKKSGKKGRADKKQGQVVTDHPYPAKEIEAVSRFTVLAYGKYKGRDVTLLGARILTGRRHQLRLHCKYMNHKIVSDLVYGDKQLDSEINAERMMLHSYYIKIWPQNDSLAFKVGDCLELMSESMTIDKYMEQQSIEWVKKSTQPSHWNLL